MLPLPSERLLPNTLVRDILYEPTMPTPSLVLVPMTVHCLVLVSNSHDSKTLSTWNWLEHASLILEPGLSTSFSISCVSFLYSDYYRRTTYLNSHLGVTAFTASDFTKGQNPQVLYQRERALGSELLNKNHYSMWLELATRLGMGRAQWDNLATYRQFMQTGGTQPRVERSSRDRSRSSGRISHDRSSSRGRPGPSYRRDEPGSSRRRSPSSDRREPAPKRGRSGSYLRRYW